MDQALAISLVHDTATRGQPAEVDQALAPYEDTDTRFIGYWEHSPLYSVQPQRVLGSLYLREKGTPYQSPEAEPTDPAASGPRNWYGEVVAQLLVMGSADVRTGGVSASWVGQRASSEAETAGGATRGRAIPSGALVCPGCRPVRCCTAGVRSEPPASAVGRRTA